MSSMPAASSSAAAMPSCSGATARMRGCTPCNSSARAPRRARRPRRKPRSERMRFLKQLVRSEAGSRVICWLIQLYLRLVYATGRWQAVGGEIALSLCARKQPFIAGFWHGRLLMLPLAWQRMAPLHMLISHHADGRLIAGAVRYFGIERIPGASNLGGQEALRAMVQCLKAGNCVGITPDGPDGP